MRIPTVSHGEQPPARMLVPVLVRLPDLDPPPTPEAGLAEHGEESGKFSQRPGPHRRGPGGSTGSPVAGKLSSHWAKMKSRLLLTLIVVAFAVLIGSLVFHRGPDQGPHAAGGWQNAEVQPPPPAEVVADDSPPRPHRLPALSNQETETLSDGGSQAAMQIADNAPADLVTTSSAAGAGLSQLEGSIEPAVRQAQRAHHSREGTR